MADSFLPRWSLRTEGAIMPDERLPIGQMVVVGLQHVVAMFGATVLAPILMGFDPNVAILFSGIATLIFFVVVGGRVPSYLGSSFAFIAVVIGLNLAPIAVKGISGSSFDTWIGLFTVLAVGVVAVYAPGLLGRIPILVA